MVVGFGPISVKQHCLQDLRLCGGLSRGVSTCQSTISSSSSGWTDAPIFFSSFLLIFNSSMWLDRCSVILPHLQLPNPLAGFNLLSTLNGNCVSVLVSHLTSLIWLDYNGLLSARCALFGSSHFVHCVEQERIVDTAQHVYTSCDAVSGLYIY